MEKQKEQGVDQAESYGHGHNTAPEHKPNTVRNAVIIFVVLVVLLLVGIIPKIITNNENNAAASMQTDNAEGIDDSC